MVIYINFDVLEKTISKINERYYEEIFLSVATLTLTLGMVGYYSYPQFFENEFLMEKNGEDESGEKAVAKQAAEYRMSRLLDENGEFKPEYF